MKLYFDVFDECLVKQIDFNAPPERYYEYCCNFNDSDIVIETYAVGDTTQRVQFAYSLGMQKYQTNDMLRFKRKRTIDDTLEKSGIPKNTTIRLIGIVVPVDNFVEQCKSCFNEDDALWKEINANLEQMKR